MPEQHWFDDPQRCRAAGMPETLAFLTKGEMPWFCCCACGATDCITAMSCSTRVGHLPWLLNDLDDEGETFLAEIHAD